MFAELKKSSTVEHTVKVHFSGKTGVSVPTTHMFSLCGVDQICIHSFFIRFLTVGDGGERCSLDESRVGRHAAGWIQDDNSNAALSPPLRTAICSVTSRQRWVDSVTRSESTWVPRECTKSSLDN